jgi:hypothetical protein
LQWRSVPSGEQQYAGQPIMSITRT